MKIVLLLWMLKTNLVQRKLQILHKGFYNQLQNDNSSMHNHVWLVPMKQLKNFHHDNIKSIKTLKKKKYLYKTVNRSARVTEVDRRRFWFF